MTATKRNYVSTVARIVGNLLSGHRPGNEVEDMRLRDWAVQYAQDIVAEVKRTSFQEGPDNQ